MFLHCLQEDSKLTLVSRQHVERIVGLAFPSPDHLLSVSQDGQVGLWTVLRYAQCCLYVGPRTVSVARLVNLSKH